ncbi:hypothetical protein C7N43_38795 [Sphingobacteriales bacterium UPWRP_1]|nr:hypothetical protein BVG80_00045 [Sphingobacteriales bacterium TSM_CSM]PSJ71540.1 hypothetical protein C7N43_38795 [Sphingobacteriales bacterium UPWRP_1]
MQKCLICGYVNQANTRFCIKCNNPLQQQQIYPTPDAEELGQHGNNALNETQLDVRNADVNRETVLDSGDNNMVRTTMKDSRSNRETGNQEDLSGKTRKCKCGYPLRPGEVICPNCGTNNSEPYVVQQKIEEVPVKQPNLAKTSSIESMNFGLKQPKFRLSLLKGKKALVFEGNTMLNRETLDSNNQSISKGEHAVIEFKDNKWLLRDTSSNGATFVQVTQLAELKDKDLIMIGNVIYRFEVLKEDDE